MTDTEGCWRRGTSGLASKADMGPHQSLQQLCHTGLQCICAEGAKGPECPLRSGRARPVLCPSVCTLPMYALYGMDVVFFLCVCRCVLTLILTLASLSHLLSHCPTAASWDQLPLATGWRTRGSRTRGVDSVATRTTISYLSCSLLHL